MDHKTEFKKTEQLIDSAQSLASKLRDDRHRPLYHFVPPVGWMNDINGTIFWRGRYHIFYQHNPKGAYWDQIQWGHASSVDLVHWVHHAIALEPDAGGPDRIGCFSGGAFVNKEGVPTFIYYGFPDGICLATSQDDLLVNWRKHPDNPVIGEPKSGQAGFGQYTVHDPCAWLDDDTYYVLSNRHNPAGNGDGGYLFKSQTLRDWEFVGPFYNSSRDWTEAEEDLAVPDFFPLGDRHMLLFCSHMRATQYYLGRFENERFHPEIHARMSWPGGQLGGGRTLLDCQNRRVFFDWIMEQTNVDCQRASGWSGVMTVPRILSLDIDNNLQIQPAPELKVLRFNARVYQDIQIDANSEFLLRDVQGDCLEFSIEVQQVDAQRFGLKVRCAPDDTEHTAILYDKSSQMLKIDVSQSSLDHSIRYPFYRDASATERLPEKQRYVSAQEAPFKLMEGESLKLQIFLDRSVLEVFANGRQCITQRIYPTRLDSRAVRLFSHGAKTCVNSVEAWNMSPTHS